MQQYHCTERVTCTVVEKEGNGLPVAFGRLTAPSPGGDSGIDVWRTKHPYDWANEKWEADA
ncbi:hypothetical protein [Streptomyces sp. NPDC094032]|uniref:hypothetical protein n=1 Tax=Streptomyces sp. NPDC094032 TaxID=3155308 RepID=UPI003325E6C8